MDREAVGSPFRTVRQTIHEDATMRTIDVVAVRVTALLLACAGTSAPFADAHAQASAAPSVTRTVNRSHAIVQEDGRSIVRLDEKPGGGSAFVQEAPFTEGTIELDVRGEDVQQQSFPGVAFGVQNDSTYEAVYLRPFNFRTADTARQKRAVQYIAPPGWDWPRLREESPGKYEHRVLPVPDPTSWVRLRLVITRTQVSVYANGGAEPDLVVSRLGAVKAGPVALWVGNNSRGDFANLTIRPTTSGTQ
jgi:hypothetical protein